MGQEKNSGRRKTENCCYFSGMKLRERFVVHENLMSTSTWTEGESGIGSELLRSTIPPENATSSEWNTKFKDRRLKVLFWWVIFDEDFNDLKQIAILVNRSQLVSISDEAAEGSRQTPRNRWAQCREMSLNKNKQRISTAQVLALVRRHKLSRAFQKDLDGILNIETEQRNALAAVSRILNQYSSHR